VTICLSLRERGILWRQKQEGGREGRGRDGLGKEGGESGFCFRYWAFTCATRYYRKGSRMLLLGLSEDAFDSRRATWDLALKVLFAFL
jgi:hypothetical protein